MENSLEMSLKKLCCTCLSGDRKLFQLCRVNDGVNNLYSLLSCDMEAYREGFYKEAASLFVCWECEAVLRRLTRFRRQACQAQKQLTCITEGWNNVKSPKTCLSWLVRTHKVTYDFTITSESGDTDNFIDCGPHNDDIKTEDDDYDDIPLAELHNNYLSDNNNDSLIENGVHKKAKVKVKNNNMKNDTCKNKYKDYIETTQMREEEMIESRVKRKMGDGFCNAAYKCESCAEVFKSQIGLQKHNGAFHVEKDNHIQCSICLSYVPQDEAQIHQNQHYTRHGCLICEYHTFTKSDIRIHLKEAHSIKNVGIRKKKGVKKSQAPKSESKSRRGEVTKDQPTPLGYPCSDCDKYFDNKNLRWKHVQRHHREGFKCAACGKRFAFKNNLSRHELVHQGPPPREKCPVCNKNVRVDLLKVHARIHSRRERHACVECAKSFVSRASYEHHLKYTQAHANRDILKYKCEVCEKGYRSRGELRDHVNYQHIGQTRHKCPVCGKALATRRCITRHVRRAHQGVKEGPRDKICQQCGKAFRDKKGLREHEWTHTGERPLACEQCGRAFRQSASLYAHRRRVHHVRAPRRALAIVADAH